LRRVVALRADDFLVVALRVVFRAVVLRAGVLLVTAFRVPVFLVAVLRVRVVRLVVFLVRLGIMLPPIKGYSNSLQTRNTGLDNRIFYRQQPHNI